jgi:hypothetical protein
VSNLLWQLRTIRAEIRELVATHEAGAARIPTSTLKRWGEAVAEAVRDRTVDDVMLDRVVELRPCTDTDLDDLRDAGMEAGL